MSTPNPLDAIGAALPDFDGEDNAAERLTLREQSRRDPAKGCPVKIYKGTEVVEEIEPGGWRAGFSNYVSGLPENCPIVPLGQGQDGQTFYFLNSLGVVHTLAPNAGKGHIDALFSGRPAYLCWAWPQWSMPKSKNERPQVRNWAAEEARQDLFAACAYKGVFELEDRVRGRGAWRDDDGGLIYHAGDAVWIDGKWRAPGEHGRFIYPGRPKIGRPSLRYEKAGEGSPGDVLLQALMSWNWDRGELDARLCLGWLMTAMVGGALEQRPVVYVIGSEGAGKSTLQRLLRWLMNNALVATSNTTQAGIYQKVRQDSIAVMVDEMEPKEDTRVADKILELARIAYSGDKMQRGGKDGVGQEFAVMSSFLFSSIAMPAMSGADASRMGVLQMREREAPTDGSAPPNILADLGLLNTANSGKLGQQLLKRMIEWFGDGRWDALRRIMRETLLKAGHEDRSADTFGALAAGCHAALRDDMPDAAELARWSEWLAADKLVEVAGREKTWRRCFNMLLNAQPDVWRTYSHKSVASWIEAWKAAPQTLAFDEMKKRLPEAGVTISFADGSPEDFEHARLFVPTTQPALNALFKGTEWTGRMGHPGPWIGVLRLMPKRLWHNGACGAGLDQKAKGVFIKLAEVLEV